jgi:lipid-binding SYLF domain-containing protein
MSPNSIHSGIRGRLDRREILVLVAASALARPDISAAAATASELASASRLALDQLYGRRPEARAWGRDAKAILVFPKITKAGVVMVGGQTGDGALLVRGDPIAFYRIFAGSFGLQLGAQTFSYAMFFMTQKAVDYARESEGWAVGSGPSVVMIDEGKAKNMNTTTMRDDIYAVAWGQQGLMAGLGLEGSKISKIHPKAN